MPGTRGEKQQGHREALLQNPIDSSSMASGSGLAGQSAFASRLPPPAEADIGLPNTVDAFGSSGGFEPGTLSAPVPSPSSFRLSPRPVANAHPLASNPSSFAPASSPSQPPIPGSFCTASNGPAAVATTTASAATAAAAPTPIPQHGPGTLRSSPSLSGSMALTPPAASAGLGSLGGGPAVAGSASCARTAGGGGPLARTSSSNGGRPGSETFPAECRICLLSEPVGDLVSPCHCTGSLAYAHFGCLRTWVVEKRSIHCELCGTMYKEPYGSELAASIPPAPPPQPQTAVVRRLTTPDGQQIIIMPVGVGLGPGAIGPLLQHHGANGGPAVVQAGVGVGLPDPRDLEPQPLCEWRNMWSYALILLLLLFAIIYVTVIAKRGRQEPWMMTLWQVLLVVLPIYLVLRIAFDLYRHRLAQQLAAANMQAMAMANAAADAAAAAGHPGGPREVIITRAGNRVLVLQRAGP